MIPDPFIAGALRILFFSRGRGRGHAIPDIAIVEELAKLRGDIDLRFVSYGTGAMTFTGHGRPVIDLEMSDTNPLWTTVVRAGELISQMQPDLIISHEEFAVLPVAKIFKLPAVFITDWFANPEDLRMQTLSYADEVIFIEDPGTSEEPPSVEGKVHYTGPVLRSFAYGRCDRDRARGELGFPQDATLILVVPGSWTEEKAPIYDLLTPVFNDLKAPHKLLVWIAGADYEMLTDRFEGRADVIVKEHDWQMDRLMVASDLAITKGNRITIKELAALGIPSISISHGRNPIDDVLIERIPTNTTLDARTVSRKMLAETMVDILKENANHIPNPTDGLPPKGEGAVLAAQHLARIIEKIRRQGGRTSLSAAR